MFWSINHCFSPELVCSVHSNAKVLILQCSHVSCHWYSFSHLQTPGGNKLRWNWLNVENFVWFWWKWRRKIVSWCLEEKRRRKDCQKKKILSADVWFFPRAFFNSCGWWKPGKDKNISDQPTWVAERNHLMPRWQEHDETSSGYFWVNLIYSMALQSSNVWKRIAVVVSLYCKTISVHHGRLEGWNIGRLTQNEDSSTVSDLLKLQSRTRTVPWKSNTSTTKKNTYMWDV